MSPEQSRGFAGEKPRRKRVEIKHQRQRMTSMFEEDLDYEQTQAIMDGIYHSDFCTFRNKFLTFTDVFGKERQGVLRIKDLFDRIEQFLKSNEIAVGRDPDSVGYSSTRFILAGDLEKLKGLLGKSSAKGPSETQHPIF